MNKDESFERMEVQPQLCPLRHEGFLLQIRHNGRAAGRSFAGRPFGEKTVHPPTKREPLGLSDNFYGFPEMEIAIEEDGIDEELKGKRLLLAIRLGSILNTGQWRSKQNSLSRSSDLFSSKLLYPATHSLSRFLSEIQNDVGILIEIEDGKVFLGIDDDGILP